MEEPSRWSHWRAIGLLLLIAGGLRAWQLTHTEVASRDSISYIRIAWHLEHDDWRSYLPLSTHHPGYPVAVLSVSYLVRPFLPEDLPRAMQLSAQLASSLAGILLVVPMYYLGRELFDRRVAFWTALLFQCLPAGGRVLGDGLSEGLFLLLAVSSLTLGCQSLRTGSWAGLGLTGLLSALAYLTRPEGAGVALAVGLVLLGLLALCRGSARRCLIGGVSLTVGFLSLALPFMLFIGHITLKNTGHMMLEKVAAVEPTSSGVMSSSLLWASWDEARWDRNNPRSQGGAHQVRWALGAFGHELVKGYFYVLWLPVLLGLMWFRERFNLIPGAWAVLLLCLILAVILFLVAVVGGYLSERHLLLILLCGLYWGVAALLVLAETAREKLAYRWPALIEQRWMQSVDWTRCLLVLLCVGPVFRTLEPLHADRVGFKEAGRWLAENTGPSDQIEDPYTWASFYAGRLFQEALQPRPQTCYIVLEESPNVHPHITSLNELERKARTGEVVFRWPVRRSKANAEVRIYAVRN